MTSLGILVAPSGLVPLGLRDHLTDWVAAGLVKPFLWVRDDKVTVDGTEALLIAPDGATPVQLQSYLGRVPADELVLCVLVPAIAGAATVAPNLEGAVWQQLGGARNNARIVPIRCLLARDFDPIKAEVGSAGWHNVVVSAEHSADPTVGIAPLPPTTDPDEIGRHAAVAVAGLAGLWVGCVQSPLAGLTPVNGRFARLARAHLLWADATSLSHAIEDQTLDTSVVPRPTVNLGTTTYIDDAAAAADLAATSLLRAHAHELKSQRDSAPAPKITELGIGAALKMLWGFLAKALVNAPGTWSRSLLARARAQIAEVVHRQVFGEGSSYQVVADMRTASPLEISHTAQQLGAHLDRGQYPGADRDLPWLVERFRGGRPDPDRRRCPQRGGAAGTGRHRGRRGPDPPRGCPGSADSFPGGRPDPRGTGLAGGLADRFGRPECGSEAG